MATTRPSSATADTSSCTKASDKIKKGEKAPSETSSKSNVIALCLFLVGIGAILGYIIFVLLFRSKCAELLSARDKSHNASQSALQIKYDTALSDVRQCQDDSKAKGELQELHGRLKAQAALSDKHQDLLERHEHTLERISELQKSGEGSKAQIETLREGIRVVQVSLQETKKRLEEAEQERDDIQRTLQGQLVHATNVVQEREREVEKLTRDLHSCGKIQDGASRQLQELKNLVQQQNQAAVVAMFGSGPYTIRFNLEFPSEPIEPNFFEVKIFNPMDLPHSVLTLLSIIDKDLYLDTAIDFARDHIIAGGNPDTVEPRHTKTNVFRKFANFGYAAHNTLFFENEASANTPCRKMSFGFNGRGPGFVIYMTNDIGEHNPHNCPGVVTRGRNTLERILDSHVNEENGQLTWRIPIVATYILPVHKESAQEEISHSEL